MVKGSRFRIQRFRAQKFKVHMIFLARYSIFENNPVGDTKTAGHLEIENE